MAFAELCNPLPCLQPFPRARESFQKADETGEEFGTDPSWDLSRHPPLVILATLGPGFELLMSLFSLVSVVFWNSVFDFFWILNCWHCLFGWTERLILRSRFRFLSNLSLQMSVLQHWVKWCFAFYVCKQHMVCSQLLKLTKYLRICLNARSYRKCKFITYYFSFDSHDRFLESAPRRFFFVCYHYFAFVLMLIFFLCLSPITLVLAVATISCHLWRNIFLHYGLFAASSIFIFDPLLWNFHISFACPAKLYHLIDMKFAASSLYWPKSLSASSWYQYWTGTKVCGRERGYFFSLSLKVKEHWKCQGSVQSYLSESGWNREQITSFYSEFGECFLNGICSNVTSLF